jgi:uncharacterized protein (DUF1697 family)
MTRYVALLRGINVGGHRVKMHRLRGLFEDLGLEEVSTVLASGNVIFETDSEEVGRLRTAIERRLERQLGYQVDVFLRTAAELAAIAACEPVERAPRSDSPASHYVIFMHAPASQSLKTELETLGSDMDVFQFSGREVHWRIRGKLSESPLFGAGMDRATRGVATTMRNMNTVRRLVAKAS